MFSIYNIMNRLVIYSLGAVLLLGTFAGASVMGQMYGSGTGGSGIVVIRYKAQ